MCATAAIAAAVAAAVATAAAAVCNQTGDAIDAS